MHLQGTWLGRSWLEKKKAAMRKEGRSCLTIIALQDVQHVTSLCGKAFLCLQASQIAL